MPSFFINGEGAIGNFPVHHAAGFDKKIVHFTHKNKGGACNLSQALNFRVRINVK
jgi:hypothetical protein